MISIKEVEIIHNILIDKFGGSKGIRDIGLLESALARPFATFDNNDLYPNPTEKASAIFREHCHKSPFYRWQQKNSLYINETNSIRKWIRYFCKSGV